MQSRRKKTVPPADPRTMTQTELEDLYARTLDAAARQLSYRALSAAALRDKLTETGYPDEAVEYALAYLTEHGFLNDEQYAESAVRSYARRGYGTLRIRQELTRRGVDRETAQAALAGHAPDPDTLRALLDKRLHGDLSDRKEVQKAVAFLQRRGYLWEDIRRALNEYGAEIAADFD